MFVYKKRNDKETQKSRENEAIENELVEIRRQKEINRQTFTSIMGFSGVYEDADTASVPQLPIESYVHFSNCSEPPSVIYYFFEDEEAQQQRWIL